MYIVCHCFHICIANTSAARLLIFTVRMGRTRELPASVNPHSSHSTPDPLLTPSIACIKLSFFFRKSPTVSDAFFQKHYNHIHSDLTVACKKFHAVKIARYVQLYQSPGLKSKLQELGMDVLEYDACSQIWVRKWEDWEAFAGSDEYRAALMPDAEKFMNLEKGIQVMAG
ncbi:hypothetical protein IG631_18864 [Alternaria alternata]|nr:hypothetical protein IG631_18864 [Alternaria alternata]